MIYGFFTSSLNPICAYTLKLRWWEYWPKEGSCYQMRGLHTWWDKISFHLPFVRYRMQNTWLSLLRVTASDYPFGIFNLFALWLYKVCLVEKKTKKDYGKKTKKQKQNKTNQINSRDTTMLRRVWRYVRGNQIH